ncbi:uncharacterized protein N7458_006310 [Penicillium daleae]|uniref:Anaphase-promoting complex subunit 4 WD40 domain-containing protein n=1 Tax=Penicillium daleae TaxID=63821 RepID=A0AAD6G2U3_9EURO|nr:uncharacterized protein N7458_006310 [Penicillium daleae]KAJ5449861.1 hypothetical protein N7458_006310 [Penicillium daleae]
MFIPSESVTRSSHYVKPSWVVREPETSQQWDSCVFTFEVDDPVGSLAWSWDGKLASITRVEGRTQIWSPLTGQCTHDLMQVVPSSRKSGQVYRELAWSEAGMLALVSSDYRIEIWDPVSHRRVSCLEGHRDRIIRLVWLPDGKVASVSMDSTARIWDPIRGQCTLNLNLPETDLSFAAWSQEGSLAVGIWGQADGSTIQIWYPFTGRCLSAFDKDSPKTETIDWSAGPIEAVAWSADAKLAFGLWDGTVQIWDSSNDCDLLCLKGHKDMVSDLSWSRDGKLASGSYDLTIRIWDLATGQCTFVLDGHNLEITSIDWSQNGILASGSNDGTVRVWDTASYAASHDTNRPMNEVRSVYWSPVGDRLACMSADEMLKIWDVTGEREVVLEGHSNGLEHVAWSPDGRRLALWTSSGLTVTVCDPATGQIEVLQIQDFVIPSYPFWSMDGARLVCGWSTKGALYIWDLTPGQPTNTLVAKPGSLRYEKTNARLPILHTDVGSFDFGQSLSLPKNPNHPKSDKYTGESTKYAGGFDLSSTWITWRDHKFLWLPPEYRPNDSTSGLVSDMVISNDIAKFAISCSRGRFWTIAIAYKCLLSAFDC